MSSEFRSNLTPSGKAQSTVEGIPNEYFGGMELGRHPGWLTAKPDCDANVGKRVLYPLKTSESVAHIRVWRQNIAIHPVAHDDFRQSGILAALPTFAPFTTRRSSFTWAVRPWLIEGCERVSHGTLRRPSRHRRSRPRTRHSGCLPCHQF